jgi:hypothetical protein
MKVVMSMLAVIISLFSGIAAANAETYMVQRGDSGLIAIAQKLSISNWKENLAKENNISPPRYIIKEGQTLVYYPQKVIITSAGPQVKQSTIIKPQQVRKESVRKVRHAQTDGPFMVRHVGGNPFRHRGNFDLAWTQFGLSDEEKAELKQKIASGEFISGIVKDGDVFDLGLEGKNILQIRPQMAWVNHPTDYEGADVYQLSSGKEIWIFVNCGNPYLRVKRTQMLSGPPPEIGFTPPGEGHEGEGESDFVYIPPVETHLVIEHEPIIGAWMWQNNLAEGKGWYGEYMAYLRQESIYGYADGWSPGAGVYFMGSDGESRVSTYTWDEKTKGFQAGMKFTDPKFQFGAKLRLVWEEMDGSNAEGYSMHQDNVKLGAYTEYLDWRHLKDGWYWGATAEAWWALDRSISSSWSGDKPSERDQYSVNLFVQKKLSEDWQVRGSGGLFYQSWDDLMGVKLQAELRWKEIVMFGPWVSFYPFGISDVYSGYGAGDLTTLGLFVRVELAGILRAEDQERRMEAIKTADRQWLDDLLAENNIQ